MYIGIGKTNEVDVMTDLEPDRRALTNGTGLVNGTGLTDGWGMKNGFGLTDKIGFVNGSRPVDGLHPFTKGFTNGKRAEESSGLKVEVNLINGLSVKTTPVLEGPPSGWGRSTRKWKAVLKALFEKSLMPLPVEREASTVNHKGR